jgi:hypothetical protein
MTSLNDHADGTGVLMRSFSTVVPAILLASLATACMHTTVETNLRRAPGVVLKDMKKVKFNIKYSCRDVKEGPRRLTAKEKHAYTREVLGQDTLLFPSNEAPDFHIEERSCPTGLHVHIQPGQIRDAVVSKLAQVFQEAGYLIVERGEDIALDVDVEAMYRRILDFKTKLKDKKKSTSCQAAVGGPVCFKYQLTGTLALRVIIDGPPLPSGRRQRHIAEGEAPLFHTKKSYKDNLISTKTLLLGAKRYAADVGFDWELVSLQKSRSVAYRNLSPDLYRTVFPYDQKMEFLLMDVDDSDAYKAGTACAKEADWSCALESFRSAAIAFDPTDVKQKPALSNLAYDEAVALVMLERFDEARKAIGRSRSLDSQPLCDTLEAELNRRESDQEKFDVLSGSIHNEPPGDRTPPAKKRKKFRVDDRMSKDGFWHTACAHFFTYVKEKTTSSGDSQEVAASLPMLQIQCEKTLSTADYDETVRWGECVLSLESSEAEEFRKCGPPPDTGWVVP